LVWAELELSGRVRLVCFRSRVLPVSLVFSLGLLGLGVVRKFGFASHFVDYGSGVWRCAWAVGGARCDRKDLG